MGDNAPEVVKIACPGCQTQFRLKPKKGRLPKGPVPCPKCAESIPVVEKNIRRLEEDGDKKQSAPQSRVFSTPTKKAKRPESPKGDRRGTVMGSPIKPPSEAQDEDLDDDPDLDDLDISPGLSDSDPKSTFMGMGHSPLQALNKTTKKKRRDSETASVDEETLDKVRSESSVVDDEEDSAPASADQHQTKPKLEAPEELRKQSRDLLKDTSERDPVSPEPDQDEDEDANLRQTAEKQAVSETQSKEATSENLRRTAENQSIDPSQVSGDDADDEDSEKDGAAPKKKILGKLKLKKKLASSLKKARSKESEDTESAAEETSQDQGEEAEKTKKTKKPSLSSLLAKARDRKDKLNLPKPKKPTKAAKDDQGEDEFDEALDALADETAKALNEEDDEAGGAGEPGTASQTGEEKADDTKESQKPMFPPSSPDEEVDQEGEEVFPQQDSKMVEMLRRRVAENEQPGAASERRGSGYIRLPTAEIQDVLGQGTYRLRVENIVYEPVDKQGLTTLIKRGVLLGAEQIAEADGDWMPIADHPVFKKLRRKMAREAHDLLNQYSGGASEDKKPAPLPKATDSDDFEDLAGVPAVASDTDTESKETGVLDADDELAADGGQPEGRPIEAPAKPSGPPPAHAEAEKSEEIEVADDLEFSDAEEVELPTASEAEKDTQSSSPPTPPPPEAKAPPAPEPAPPEQAVEADEAAEPAQPGEPAPIEDAQADESGSWLPLILAIVVVGGVAALALSPMGKPYLDKFLGGQTDTAPKAGPKSTKAGTAKQDQGPDPGVEEAMSTASSTLTETASAIDPGDPKLQRDVAEQLAEAGEHRAAARILGVVWKDNRSEAALAARYAKTLLEAGEFSRARTIAVQGIQLDDASTDFEALFERSVRENPALAAYEVVELEPERLEKRERDDRTELAVFGGGEHVSTFKPSQSGWEDDWRADIASWRLCQVMVCAFEVPRTRPARISRAAVEKLMGDDGVPGGLSWTSAGDEGTGEYVYGSLQDAVPGAARWPIESVGLWRPWLDAGDHPDLKAVEPEDALSDLKSLEPNFYEPIVSELDGATVPEMAAQVSSVLLFDYLTNNWDRFRNGEPNWGTNLHFAHGDLVSMHNGGAFQPRASTRVKGRFSWTSRFSRDTITSLRAMKPEMVSPLLFPDASAAERAKLKVFWDQRDRALGRVDELLEAHGEQDVLAFD